jgi:hypothetical protein
LALRPPNRSAETEIGRSTVIRPTDLANGDPILEVLNYPDNQEEWDMANADLIGLQEANGVRFREDAQLFGVVAP